MEIRFISSLTAEDESQFAPVLLKAIGAVLDHLPIAYTLRIQTSGAEVFEHAHVAPDQSAPRPVDADPPKLAGGNGFPRLTRFQV